MPVCLAVGDGQREMALAAVRSTLLAELETTKTAYAVPGNFVATLAGEAPRLAVHAVRLAILGVAVKDQRTVKIHAAGARTVVETGCV